MKPFPLNPATHRRLTRIGDEFLADFLRRALERDPRNLAALAELGHVLTRLGRLEEGLAADERLVRLVPQDPLVHYNHACSLALLGRAEEAFDALENALANGYADAAFLRGDEDLASLRSDPRFALFIERLEARTEEDAG